jgi:ubiquitin-activating enzyme E1
MGLASYAFLDYGPEFKVTDKDGEATKQFIISSIENGQDPVVHVHEDKRHSYQDDDYVKFIEVEGMTELNGLPHVQIYETRAYSFKLRLDTSSFGAYTRQGLVEDIKVPKDVSFQSFAESCKNPAAATEFGFLEPLDMNYFGMGRSE